MSKNSRETVTSTKKKVIPRKKDTSNYSQHSSLATKKLPLKVDRTVNFRRFTCYNIRESANEILKTKILRISRRNKKFGTLIEEFKRDFNIESFSVVYDEYNNNSVKLFASNSMQKIFGQNLEDVISAISEDMLTDEKSIKKRPVFEFLLNAISSNKIKEQRHKKPTRLTKKQIEKDEEDSEEMEVDKSEKGEEDGEEDEDDEDNNNDENDEEMEDIKNDESGETGENESDDESDEINGKESRFKRRKKEVTTSKKAPFTTNRLKNVVHETDKSEDFSRKKANKATTKEASTTATKERAAIAKVDESSDEADEGVEGENSNRNDNVEDNQLEGEDGEDCIIDNEVVNAILWPEEGSEDDEINKSKSHGDNNNGSMSNNNDNINTPMPPTEEQPKRKRLREMLAQARAKGKASIYITGRNEDKESKSCEKNVNNEGFKKMEVDENEENNKEDGESTDKELRLKRKQMGCTTINKSASTKTVPKKRVADEVGNDSIVPAPKKQAVNQKGVAVKKKTVLDIIESSGDEESENADANQSDNKSGDNVEDDEHLLDDIDIPNIPN